MIEWNWKKLKIYKLFSPYWKWLLVTDYSDQNREKVSFKNIAVFENTLFQLDVQRHPEYCCLILHLSYCSRSICQFSSKEYQLFIFSRFQTIFFLCMISLLPLYFSVSPKNKFVLYMYSRIWHSIKKKALLYYLKVSFGTFLTETTLLTKTLFVSFGPKILK